MELRFEIKYLMLVVRFVYRKNIEASSYLQLYIALWRVRVRVRVRMNFKNQSMGKVLVNDILNF